MLFTRGFSLKDVWIDSVSKKTMAPSMLHAKPILFSSWWQNFSFPADHYKKHLFTEQHCIAMYNSSYCSLSTWNSRILLIAEKVLKKFFDNLEDVHSTYQFVDVSTTYTNSSSMKTCVRTKDKFLYRAEFCIYQGTDQRNWMNSKCCWNEITEEASKSKENKHSTPEKKPF